MSAVHVVFINNFENQVNASTYTFTKISTMDTNITYMENSLSQHCILIDIFNVKYLVLHIKVLATLFKAKLNIRV